MRGRSRSLGGHGANGATGSEQACGRDGQEEGPAGMGYPRLAFPAPVLPQDAALAQLGDDIVKVGVQMGEIAEIQEMMEDHLRTAPGDKKSDSIATQLYEKMHNTKPLSTRDLRQHITATKKSMMSLVMESAEEEESAEDVAAGPKNKKMLGGKSGKAEKAGKAGQGAAGTLNGAAADGAATPADGEELPGAEAAAAAIAGPPKTSSQLVAKAAALMGIDIPARTPAGGAGGEGAEDAAEEDAAPGPVMDDVDSMKRDEMWEEIKTLRENQQALMGMLTEFERTQREESQAARGPSQSGPGQGRGIRGKSWSVGTKTPDKLQGAGTDPGARSSVSAKELQATPMYEQAGFPSRYSFLSAIARVLRRAGEIGGRVGASGAGAGGDENTNSNSKAAGKGKRSKAEVSPIDKATAVGAVHEARIEALKMKRSYKKLMVDIPPTPMAASQGSVSPGPQETPFQPTQAYFEGIFKVPESPPASPRATAAPPRPAPPHPTPLATMHLPKII